ncbi:MAG: hypothetical protein COA78_22795 [Blastopirellula sp.]|nr:MAG: hypothetical protein COA78_22795 [Blastopirellula sp.]
MITVERFISILFLVASLLVDFVLYDMAGSQSGTALPAMLLWGFLFAQCGLVASFLAQGTAFPLLRFMCLVFMVLFSALLLASLTELSGEIWVGILTVHVAVIVVTLIAIRVYYHVKRQFSLSEIFAATTLVALLCGMFPHVAFPWNQAVAIVPAVLGFTLPVLFYVWLVQTERYQWKYQAMLIFWAVALGQVAGLFDGTPGAGFLLSAFNASCAFYLLAAMMVKKHSQTIRIPILKFQARSVSF